MEVGSSLFGDREITSGIHEQHLQKRPAVKNRAVWTLYSLALVVSISTWLLAVRAPLCVDETGSYWQISAGFSEIWPRSFSSLSFPAYSYVLWLITKLFGSSEILLRSSSFLAMLGAVYLLYISARELFEPEFAVIAALIFSLNPTVVYAAIDVRPYALAVLFTNAAILTLLRLRRSNSNWLAGLFGLMAAGVVYFHYLFAAILPALLLCFIAFKVRNRRIFWQQLGSALAVFTFALVPLVPGLQYLFHTASKHVVSSNLSLVDLLWTLMPGWLVPAAALTFLSFAARSRSIQIIRLERWRIIFCASLALIPASILYIVSATTTINVFLASPHRLSAIPAISLCWAMALYRFRSQAIRAMFLVIFMVATVGSYLDSPTVKQHSYSWKYALQVVERNASEDNSPVLVCSNFIESNYTVMSADSPKTTFFFAPLSYYRLSVPIVPLPEALNSETVRIFSPFLREAEQKNERFLAVGHTYSFTALDWIAQSASKTYSVRTLGVYDGVKVLEFVPRDNPLR